MNRINNNDDIAQQLTCILCDLFLTANPATICNIKVTMGSRLPYCHMLDINSAIVCATVGSRIAYYLTGHNARFLTTSIIFP